MRIENKYFAIKDDFKPSDLKLICDCPDASQDSDSIAMLYYKFFDDIRDKYRDTPFDEDSIVEYNLSFFELDFSGGSDGWYAVLQKDKDGYSATHFATILGSSFIRIIIFSEFLITSMMSI